MTNEIKEKIDDIFWEVKKHPMDSDYLVKKEEMELLLDYITNLQEENERYKKIFEGKERFSKIMPDDMDFIILSKADYDRQQEDIELTAIKMKQRIDKAIDYINDLYVYGSVSVPELLNILRGDE